MQRTLARALTLLLACAVAGISERAAAAQPAPTPRLRIPWPKDDGSLTPYTFERGYALVTLIYDTLMWRDARGVPRPWLARSLRRRRDGRRLTIRLRRGVRWHDGVPLTASDVVFTFQFVATHWHARFTPELSDVAGVTALGRLTLAIDLRHTSLGFEDQPLADLPIIPRHIWQRLPPGAIAPRGPPIGSGPYRLVGHRVGKGYSFRANRSYFLGRPKVDRIRVPIIRDSGRTFRALGERRVDMVPATLPEDEASQLGEALGIRLRQGALYTGTALLLNLRAPPFDRPGVRRAIAKALDLRRISRTVGQAVPADRGYIHPASPWASPRPLQRFDPAARATLVGLGLPAVPVLAPDNDPVRVEAGRQVVLALRRAGVQANLAKVSREELVSSIGEDGSIPSFQAAIVSTPSLESYDPDFLSEEFSSDQGQAPLNRSGYRSGSFDRLAAQVAGARDRRTRRRAVGRELRLLARDLPAIPLFFSRGTFAYRPDIYDGWVYIRGSGLLDKRSFLATRATPTGPAVSNEPPDGADDSGTSLYQIVRAVALGLLAVAIAVGLAGLIARRG